MPLPEYHISIHTSPESIKDAWQKIDNVYGALASGYAAYKAWTEALGAHNHDAVIILGEDKEGVPLFLLPLVKKSYGPCRVLTRPAMKHLAYYKGIFTPEFMKEINAHNADTFWRDVLSHIKDVDALWIDGVCEPAAKRGHPLSYLDHFTSSNPCHIMQIEEDWEAQYASCVSSKKRSNDRRMVRLINEVAEYKFCVPQNIEDKVKLLHKMFGQKKEYFEATGQHDPFVRADIRKFYEQMLRIDHETGKPCYEIAGIYAGDQLLACILGGRQGEVFHGMIISRTMSELSKYSPGRLLLIELNRHLSTTGIKAHNFGTGQYDYKNGWCDQVMARRHVTFALTLKGQVFVKLLKLAASVKKTIKDGNYQQHPVVGKMRTAFGV